MQPRQDQLRHPRHECPFAQHYAGEFLLWGYPRVTETHQTWMKRKAELEAAAQARGSTLMEIHGIGPAGAARILADVGEIARFAGRNQFASWTGTAPLDASSGELIRHRLSRAGNRRVNHVIHIAAIVQLRHDTEGCAYYRRQLATGKTRLDALRC